MDSAVEALAQGGQALPFARFKAPLCRTLPLPRVRARASSARARSWKKIREENPHRMSRMSTAIPKGAIQ